MPGSPPSSLPSTCRMPGPRDRERRIHWTFDDSSLPAVGRARRRGRRQARHSTCSTRRSTGPTWSGLRLALPVPVVVKGILDPEDAVAARPSTAPPASSSRTTAAASSTARCRRSRRCRRSSTRSATGSRCCFDGGIRRGTDVATALALGAQAVLAGRMPLWGLAAGGEDGAREVLELLREELAIALHLTGCRSVAELSAGEPRPARSAGPVESPAP